MIISRREVSVGQFFEAKIALKRSSPLWNVEPALRTVERTAPAFHWIFPPTKEMRSCLLIEPLISHVLKFFAGWRAQFVSALVNRLKAAPGT